MSTVQRRRVVWLQCRIRVWVGHAWTTERAWPESAVTRALVRREPTEPTARSVSSLFISPHLYCFDFFLKILICVFSFPGLRWFYLLAALCICYVCERSIACGGATKTVVCSSIDRFLRHQRIVFDGVVRQYVTVGIKFRKITGGSSELLYETWIYRCHCFYLVYTLYFYAAAAHWTAVCRATHSPTLQSFLPPKSNERPQVQRP